MDQSSPDRRPAILYDGRVGELYSVFLMNLLWTALTLGIFRFWAITRTRRYLWSRTRFQGERFEYTGTGGELFVGVLLVVLILIGAVFVGGLLVAILFTIWWPLGGLAAVLLYAAFAALVAGAVFSAQRYRLSRTLWVGIRGGMDGSMLAYGARSLLYGAAVVLSLFLLAPWRSVRLAEERINASTLGNLRFGFQGRARSIYLPYLATLLGIVALLAVIAVGVWTVMSAYWPELQAMAGSKASPSPAQAQLIYRLAVVAIVAELLFILGAALISLWYMAVFERHVIGRTTLGSLRFSSTLTGRGLLGLMLGNLLILLFTLGFGLPVTQQRTMRFLARNLWVSGVLDLPALQQGNAPQPRLAEGLFQVLDGGAVI